MFSFTMHNMNNGFYDWNLSENLFLCKYFRFVWFFSHLLSSVAFVVIAAEEIERQEEIILFRLGNLNIPLDQLYANQPHRHLQFPKQKISSDYSV